MRNVISVLIAWCLVAIVLPYRGSAQPNVQWVASVPNGGNVVYRIATDPNGQVYAAGETTNTTQVGAVNFPSGRYLAKSNAAGVWQWVEPLPTAITGLFDIAYSSPGVLSLVGRFNNSLTLGSTTLTGGSSTYFIASFNLTTRQWQWAHTLIANSSNPAIAAYYEIPVVRTDNAGNIYLAGNYDGQSLTAGPLSLTATGTGGSYVAKLDAAGNWQWLVGGSNSVVKNLAVSPSGSQVAAIGTFGNSATFGTNTVTGPEAYNTWIGTLDAATGQWQRTVVIAGYGGSSSNCNVNYLNTTDVIITGAHQSATTVGSSSFSGIGLYVARLNATTGQWVWATDCSVNSQDVSMGLDGTGNAYVAGSSPGGPHLFGSYSVSSQFYIAQISPSGQWQAAIGLSGAMFYSFARASTGMLVAGMAFSSQAFGNSTIPTGGFVASLTGTLLANRSATSAAVNLYPNPTAGHILLRRPNGLPANATILDGLGREVRRLGPIAESVELDLHSLAPGFYTLRLEVSGQLPIIKRIEIE